MRTPMRGSRPDPDRAPKRVGRRDNGSGHRRRDPEEQPEPRPHQALLPRHGPPHPHPLPGFGAQAGLHLLLDTRLLPTRREEQEDPQEARSIQEKASGDDRRCRDDSGDRSREGAGEEADVVSAAPPPEQE